ncbi:hypothetical protein BJV78DRAFT_1136769, partial [Lactifluus subvellereus]
VFVLCAVSGVQVPGRTIAVDRQMRRYNVPRLSFIDKMGRLGADPWRVINQIRTKLRILAIAVQVLIGVEDQLKEVLIPHLVGWKAIYNKGTKGIEVIELDEIPVSVLELATKNRTELEELQRDEGEFVLMGSNA